jgi:glycosyltransferase involved in cell wall biosynthesis
MSASPRPTISVVIPVHNEADFLPQALPSLFKELDTVDADITVLIAENGSTDETSDLVRDAINDYPNLSLLELPTPNYGAAMRDGFLATDGDWVVNFDIDYFSGAFLSAALALHDEADIVLASKRVEGSKDDRGFVRVLATWAFNMVLKFMLGSGVSDTHGMKLIRREVVDQIVPKVVSTVDLFDTELVVRAEQEGFRITELPIEVRELRDAKSSLFKRVPRTLKGVWRIRKQFRNERSQH